MATTTGAQTAHDDSLLLRLVLEGDEARLGDIPAADVARLIDGAIRVVARAAELIAGRQPGRVGRRGAAVEQATRFRFVESFSGSVGVLVRGPAPVTTDLPVLELDDPPLTELALASTLDSLSGPDADAHIARALTEFADELGIGARYTAVRLSVEGGAFPARGGVLDRPARDRLHRIAGRAPAMAAAAVRGTLVEADFERHTARLRTSSNRIVRVSFDEVRADDVQQALRQHAEFDGVVTYDSSSQHITAVELRSVRRTRQLHLDLEGGEFWREPTIDELAGEQGIRPANLDEMRDATPSTDELDRFFEALDL